MSRRYTDADAVQTRAAAEHHYQLWTGPELQVALQVDERGRWALSKREAALTIGRTSAAVQAARSAYRRPVQVSHQEDS